jgi:KDO2-lipid IV(A) lauroyltransferase
MNIIKWPIHIIETLLYWVMIVTTYVLPIHLASALGGKLFSGIGPWLPINRIARINLKRAFPDLTEVEAHRIIKGMWDNIGRTIFEYSNLPAIDPLQPSSGYEFRGLEHLDQLIKSGKPGLLFTAHLGHWEIGNYIASKRGLKLAQVTRFLNNPLLRKGVNFIQGRIAQEIIPKGKEGIWKIIACLRRGTHVSMMLDQKMNEGVAVPFFGYDAMTAPAIAKLALKFDCPIVPVQVERLSGVPCRVTFHPPLKRLRAGTMDEKIYDLLRQVNQHIESWIRQAPEQWFWIHKRWGKEIYYKKDK